MVQLRPRKASPPTRFIVLLAFCALLLGLPAAASAHTLQPPTNLQATVTGDGVALTWTASSDGHTAGYNVYRRTSGGSFVAVSQEPGTTFTDAGATGGTYHVTGFDDQGGESAPTNDASAGSGSGGAAASQPADSASVTVGNDYFSPSTVDIKPGATVTWHFNGNHTVTADSGQTETFNASQSSGDFAHTFTQEGRFTYQCTRHSGMTGVVIVRQPSSTPDTTAPGTPTGLSATPGDGMVTLHWADVSAPDLSAYRVERQNLDGSWTTLAEPTSASYTDAGLANGATYAYRVSAVDLNGNASAPSDAATATPAATAVGPAERQITVGGYAFGPEDLVVNKGDTVVWTWVGPDLNHSVTSAAGSAETFESHPGAADSAVTSGPAGGFRHTFTSTGTFSYLCRVHPDMTGTVTVVEGGADSLQGTRSGAGATATPQAQNAAVPAARNHTAKVAEYKFTPATLTIPQGDSVTWEWTGSDKDHSVSAKPGQADDFDSHLGLKTGQIKTAPAGGKFVHTFAKLGTFTYICRLHPNMVGTVNVVPRGAASGAPLRLNGVRKPVVRGGRMTVRFKLGAAARIRADLRRGSKRLRSYRFAGRKGSNVKRLTLPRSARRGGTFRLVLSATRTSGDRSAPVTVAVRIPRRR